MPEYTPEIFDTICERIGRGESLRAICREKDMPSTFSVMKWLTLPEKYPGLTEQYMRARELQADYWAEEILDVVHDKKLEDPNKLAHARAKIDVYKWTAGKLRPKVYNDRLIHAGDDDAPIVYAEVALRLVKPDA